MNAKAAEGRAARRVKAAIEAAPCAHPKFAVPIGKREFREMLEQGRLAKAKLIEATPLEGSVN